ncbi:CBO0543 family protein [Priestia megaterium]|uniref:CBO0543 family protein n=1 Tax=Priestia megaterium TaxID=1404 RepID=UPI00188F0916|nr:CBO0543 family protein [Priestia megaterium]
MKFETVILIIIWILMAIVLWRLVPRHKIIDAHISFLFMQVITWLFGTLVVENRLIKYPVRFLDYAYKASFSFEYYLYPSISALFNLYFPKKHSWKSKFFYSVSYPTVITVIEVLLEKYTNLITYIHWTWYWSWITLLVTLLISYRYYIWFLKKIKRDNI